MPQTPFYIHTADESSPTAFFNDPALVAALWGDEIPPVGDLKEDEKTVETASSTLVIAALNSEFDGELFLIVVLSMCVRGVRRVSRVRRAKGRRRELTPWKGKSRLFLRNCEPFEVAGYARDLERAEELWKLSEKFGEKFEI